VLGPWLINKLQERKIGQVVRQDGPTTHLKKGGTPTGGGILVLSAIILSTLLWADLSNQYIWLALFTLCGMGSIGLLDDWRKLSGGTSRGITARQKAGLQLLVAAAVAAYPCRSLNGCCLTWGSCTGRSWPSYWWARQMRSI
jgi:phospho-N-acetylmuramoyl-pentapeptide-transferase